MRYRPEASDGVERSEDLGLIIEINDDVEVPPVLRIFWPDGFLSKEWADELEVANSENR